MKILTLLFIHSGYPAGYIIHLAISRCKYLVMDCRVKMMGVYRDNQRIHLFFKRHGKTQIRAGHGQKKIMRLSKNPILAKSRGSISEYDARLEYEIVKQHFPEVESKKKGRINRRHGFRKPSKFQ